MKNCQIYPIGASNKLQTLTLSTDGATGQGASIIEGFRTEDEYKAYEKVLVLDLDTMVKEIGISNISLVKIDVEGGELEVLQGMLGIISEDRPFIICEMLPVYDKKTEVGKMRYIRQNEMGKIVKNNQYKLLRISPKGELYEINEIGVHSDLKLCNYLLVPIEFMREFSE